MPCHWWPAKGCLRYGTEAVPCVPDHDPPLAEGGSNASIVPACPPCNARRGGELAQKRNKAAGRGRGYAKPKPPPTTFVAKPTTTRW